MVFSSELFLYGFMPIFFSLYYLIADRRKNWLILIASLIFYGIGAGSTVLVLLVSIFVNQYLALRIEPAPAARRKALLAIGVAVNPVADDLDNEIERFHAKIEAGAHFAMTQPIFDPEHWYDFVKKLGGKPSIPVLVGITLLLRVGPGEQLVAAFDHAKTGPLVALGRQRELHQHRVAGHRLLPAGMVPAE